MHSNLPNIHFVIPCAGAGSRAGRDIPKQYAKIAGKPMIAHTLSALLKVSLAQTICLVVNPQDTFIKDILLDYVQDSQGRISVVYAGGDTRAQSVLAGLGDTQGAGLSNLAIVGLGLAGIGLLLAVTN